MPEATKFRNDVNYWLEPNSADFHIVDECQLP